MALSTCPATSLIAAMSGMGGGVPASAPSGGVPYIGLFFIASIICRSASGFMAKIQLQFFGQIWIVR